MKALVTGAAGFIGSHVVDALRAEGIDVIGIDSLDPAVHHAPPDYLRRDVDYCFVDLRYWRPDSRFDDVQLIVHLAALGGVARAAREPANIIDANCTGTARLLDAARRFPRLQRVIHISSFSVYGANYSYRCTSCGRQTTADRNQAALDRGDYEVHCAVCGAEAAILPTNEEVTPAPLETYAASKYMQELCYRGFDAAPVTILRLSSAYGSRLRLEDGEATIIARLAGWIRNGERPQLLEDGRQLRDWVYVGDVAAAVMQLVRGKEAPSLINVCSGVGTRLVEACDLIAAAMGVKCNPEVVGGYRPGDMRHCIGDPTRLRSFLGRDPLPFSEGAQRAFGRAKRAAMASVE
jgi:dTDP-L-rhamnose 4-epimerase